MIELLNLTEIPHIAKITNYKKNVLLSVIPSKNNNEFNEKGYRSDSFLDTGDIKVISIGCSDVFGYQLNKEDRFCDLFCKKLSLQTQKKVVNWNLGLPGKSNDYIARTIISTKKILNPTIVLISFTRILRREWFDESGICSDYILGHKNKESHCFNALSNYNQNILNFYLNYKSIESTLNDVTFMFTLSLNTNGKMVGLEDIIKIVDKNKYIGYFETIDYADENHPGKESNLKIANLFLNKYNENKK